SDQGYAKMANTWFSALWQAAEWGWIDPPVPGGDGKKFCANNPVWYPQGEIASGAGLGSNGGNYNCSKMCVLGLTLNLAVLTLKSVLTHDHPTALVPSQSQTSLKRYLNGDGRAEYLWLDEQGVTTAFLNLGSGQTGNNAGQVQWLSLGVIAAGVGASRRQVQFADLNGDGRAEYLFVHDNGSVDAWLNLGGPDHSPNAANVDWLPQGVVATGPPNGATRDNVILADEPISHAFFANSFPAVTHTGGVVELWINGGGPDHGPNAAKVVWFHQGVIARGVGSSGVGVQFADLNGDGRAEYLDVDYLTSAVNAWLNGCS
ncbi:lipolytic enzyme, partial [Mycena albidolilacea]